MATESMSHGGASVSSAAVARCLGPSEGEVVAIVGNHVRILADGAATGGRCLIIEEITPAGVGPPLHRHLRDDEYFFVTRGKYRFVMDGKEFIAEPGAFIAAPRGSVHTFVNIGEGEGRMLIVTSPPGLEKPFREVDAAWKRRDVTREQLGAIFVASGVEIVGPPMEV
ncbi:MAG TPA: cupin domain-containing protein [Phycisphaerales bacterium]|nr:cupin domain-containing protein [Phycisphaerales bacterium]